MSGDKKTRQRPSRSPAKKGNAGAPPPVGNNQNSCEEKRRLAQFALDYAPESIIWLDQSGQIHYVNQQACTRLGYTREELLKKTLFDLDTQYNSEIWPQRWENLRKVKTLTVESNLKEKSGRIFPVEVKASLVEFEGKEFNCSYVRDITERKKVEKKFATEKAYLDQLFDNAQEAIVISDINHITFRINEEFTAIFGYSQEEALGRHIDDLVAPDSRREEAVSYTDVLGAGIKISFESIRRCNDGSEKYVSVIGSPIVVDGKIVAYYSIYRDISARKIAEAKLKASLKEKEVLLNEIHHRVKNNLQIVSSLIRLQAAKIQDKKAQEVLKESQNRIRSMAMIHEKLYQSKDFAHIDFSHYIRDLASHLFSAYRVDPRVIRLNTSFENAHLDMSTAIPCAFILTELLSNCLKHAFPGNRKGSIQIGFRKTDDGKNELSISDDGVGFPQNIDHEQTESLGMQLVTILTAQLRGSILLDRSKGTRFTIHF